MVDVPQQKLHGVGIGLRRTVKRCFPLLSGVVFLLPVASNTSRSSSRTGVPAIHGHWRSSRN